MKSICEELLRYRSTSKVLTEGQANR